MNIEIIYLLLAGFVGGFAAGLMGIGGGIIYIIILPVALQNEGICSAEVVKYTVANSAFAILIASLSGNVMNIWKGNLYTKEILYVGIPSALASIIGMAFVVSQPWYSKEIFNIVVIGLLAYMLMKLMVKVPDGKEVNDLFIPKLTFTGTLSGLVSSLSGLGGGIIVVPMLQSFFKMNIIKAKDISLGVIGIMTFFLTLYNIFSESPCKSTSTFQVGLIVFPVTMIIIAGVVVGSALGVYAAKKLPSKYITYAFVLLLFSVITTKLIEVIF